MRDELFDRTYQEGRAAMNQGIDGLIQRVGDFLRNTGEATHRVEWSAPWKTAAKSKKSGLA